MIKFSFGGQRSGECGAHWEMYVVSKGAWIATQPTSLFAKSSVKYYMMIFF